MFAESPKDCFLAASLPLTELPGFAGILHRKPRVFRSELIAIRCFGEVCRCRLDGSLGALGRGMMSSWALVDSTAGRLAGAGEIRGSRWVDTGSDS